MSTPTVYVICDQNCKFEGMTKEQILTAIVQAVNEGTISDVNTGFITTIKTITGAPLKFFVGEQSEYEALTDKEKENLFAIITNDSTKEGLLKAIEELQTNYKELKEGLQTGSFVVAKAKSATNAKNAENAENATNAKNAENAENATNATNATNAKNAENATKLKPNSNSATLTYTDTEASVAVSLERGKTYIFELTHNQTEETTVYLLNVPSVGGRTLSTSVCNYGKWLCLLYDINRSNLVLLKTENGQTGSYYDILANKSFTVNWREIYEIIET